MRKLGLSSRLLVMTSLLVSAACKTTNQAAQIKAAGLDSTAAGDASDPNAICLNAQAMIGGVDPTALQSAVQFTPYTNIKDFLASKPTIDQNLHLTYYVPDPVEGRSQYPQIWCKLKDAHDLQAAASGLHLQVVDGGQNCDAYQKTLIDATLSANPTLASQYQSLGYAFDYSNNTQLTGATFAPAPAQIILDGNSKITLRTVSLESAPGLPVVGGMNYCKLIDPAGLPELFSDIKAGNFDYLALGANVSDTELAGPDLATADLKYNGILGDLAAQEASLFYQPGASFKGSYVISPGGGVPALNMRSLAKALARKGYITYIVHYPFDYAINEKIALRNNAAVNLGAILKAKSTDGLNGLPSDLATYYQTSTTPIYGFGHSLGAAILGDAIFGGGTVPFDALIVNGALTFVTLAKQTNITAPVFFDIIGLNDKLNIKNASSIPNFEQATSMMTPVSSNLMQQDGTQHFLLQVPGMSHFCVLGDLNVHPLTLLNTANDGPAQKPKVCEPLLLNAIASQGFI